MASEFRAESVIQFNISRFRRDLVLVINTKV